MKGEKKFGFLSKLIFLQDVVSLLIAKLNPAVIHNLAKYMALKKVHYLSAIEEIEGDYLEFGVYEGGTIIDWPKINTNKNSRFFEYIHINISCQESLSIN